MIDHIAVFNDFVRKASQKEDIVKRILKNKLYQQLTTALSGSQEFTALEKLYQAYESKEFDLIILDLLMGGQALGWHFLRALYVDPTIQDIPILVVTAAGGLAREHMTAIEEWGCGYITKPFDLDDLLDAINKCLSRADGDIVAWLNCDDLYPSGALAAVARHFTQHPAAQWLVGRYEIISLDRTPTRPAVVKCKRKRLERYSIGRLLA